MQRNWQRFRQARQSLIGLIREEEVRGLTAFLCAIAICDGLLLGYMLHASNSSDPFLMAVALGAACDFLTPIGHQNNLLVMGPGGYRFGDYWRLGLPLSIMVVLVGTPLILWAWPLAG